MPNVRLALDVYNSLQKAVVDMNSDMVIGMKIESCC